MACSCSKAGIGCTDFGKCEENCQNVATENGNESKSDESDDDKSDNEDY